MAVLVCSSLVVFQMALLIFKAQAWPFVTMGQEWSSKMYTHCHTLRDNRIFRLQVLQRRFAMLMPHSALTCVF